MCAFHMLYNLVLIGNIKLMWLLSPLMKKLRFREVKYLARGQKLSSGKIKTKNSYLGLSEFQGPSTIRSASQTEGRKQERN